MSCSHLAAFGFDSSDDVISKIFENYKNLLPKLVFPQTSTDRKSKNELCRCFTCKTRRPMLAICLECIFIGCVRDGHFQAHTEKTGHALGIESTSGEVYCGECKDVVYDREIEVTRRNMENKMRKAIGFSLVHEWNPPKNELDFLKPTRKRPLVLTDKTTIGLRGLTNLGNTCFMSCILQAMTHTPLLRDYFLSDQHRCNQTAVTGDAGCLMCEMARVFQEFYGGDKKAHIPHRMLHLVWTHAHHLAGYEQQDAHEFFIATLDILHRHSRSVSVASTPTQCKCIIDRIFTGRLQSDVTCQTCFGVSTTMDPYWDISLDLGGTSSSASSDLMSSLGGQMEHPTSLHECLIRFTRPEHLEGSQAKCNSKCQSYQDVTKQLTLKKLPIVACFHLKRFEHSMKLHKKVGTYVSFPEYLDLTAFTSDYRDDKTNGDRNATLSTKDKLNRLKNKYALFAVVNHEGTLESGHYTCFVRQRATEWFKCDDHVITKASLSDVLSSQGYLLFYHKQFLDYQ